MRRPFFVVRAGLLVTVAVLLASDVSMLVLPSWIAPVQASVSPLSQDAVMSEAVQAAPDRAVMRSRFVALDVSTLPDPRRRAQLAR